MVDRWLQGWGPPRVRSAHPGPGGADCCSSTWNPPASPGSARPCPPGATSRTASSAIRWAPPPAPPRLSLGPLPTARPRLRLRLRPGPQACPRGPGEAGVGRQGAPRRPGRVTLGRARSRRRHRRIPCVACCPVSRSSDLCPRVPFGGRRRLLALPPSTVGGREGGRGPSRVIVFFILVPQWLRGSLAKPGRLGTAPEKVAGFVHPRPAAQTADKFWVGMPMDRGSGEGSGTTPPTLSS